MPYTIIGNQIFPFSRHNSKCLKEGPRKDTDNTSETCKNTRWFSLYNLDCSLRLLVVVVIVVSVCNGFFLLLLLLLFLFGGVVCFVVVVFLFCKGSIQCYLI